LAKQFKPESQERIRKCGKQRQKERCQQHTRFLTIAELAQPPHGGEGRRQVVADGSLETGDSSRGFLLTPISYLRSPIFAFSIRRGRHRSYPLRLRWR